MGDGLRLKEKRISKGYTVSKLSDETGIPKQTIYSIEAKDRTVQYRHAIKIAPVLGVDIAAISSDELSQSAKGSEEGVFFPPIDTGKQIKEFLKFLYQTSAEDIKLMHKVLVKYLTLSDEGKEGLLEYMDYLSFSDKKR